MATDQLDSFGDYIRTRREEHGYSARHVARQVGVAVTTITRIEDGSFVVPNPDLFLALVDVLDLDLITAVSLVEPYQRLWRRFTTQGH
jgi:transcriptional regulator with XRE-family HTH domain